jgi:hypothetical protein
MRVVAYVCVCLVSYGDTPGLSDMKKRKQAAAEITKSLKKDGKYRLVFVCTLESGRVRPDDVTTIETVLEAINDEEFPYGIIINKMKSRMLNKYEREAETKQAINTCLNYKHRPTNYIFAYPFDEALDDKDNEVVKPHSEFLQFLRNLPAKILLPEMVNDVNDQTFDAKKFMYEKEMAELRRDIMKMEKEVQNQKLLFASLTLAASIVGAVSNGLALGGKFISPKA